MLTSSYIPVLLSPPPLESEPVPLPLEHHGGDETLHLGRSKLLLLSVLKMFRFNKNQSSGIVALCK